MHHEQPPDRRRPFRFGVLGERIRSCEGLLAEARRAEALGYSTLLLRDHFVREPFGDQLAPMVALTAAAGATRTLRVGRLEESLRVLKGLLAGPAFTFAGAHYSVTGLEGFRGRCSGPARRSWWAPAASGCSGSQVHGQVGHKHQLVGARAGWPVTSSYSRVPPGWGTQGCSSEAGATTSTLPARWSRGGSRSRPT